MTELTAPQAPSSRRRTAADAQRRLVATGPNGATGRDVRSRRLDRLAFALAIAATVLLLGWAAAYEADTSSLQSLFISRAVKDMAFTVEPGPSAAVRFPEAGPYDRRLGYAQLPSFIDRLAARHFVVERQARQSPLLGRFIDAGGYAVYHEKAQAGLELRDRVGTPLETARYPSAAYPGFAAVPPVVAHTLRFIEDRDLLDPERPNRNPAVEWRRFGIAALGRAGKYIDPSLGSGGGSTLATQVEKFRHSPGGRTEGVVEKLRQMSTATARTYLDGPQTLAAQQQILTTYLNSTPLGSRPGYGEVIGLGDGLLAWYGTDFAEANRALATRPPAGVDLQRRAEIYKQALSLLIAQRRPSYYLNLGRGALQALANSYLRRLGAAGVIGPVLRDAALKSDLRFRSAPPSPPASSFVERKAVDAVRTELMTALGAANLYSLDRMDLAADATIDAAAQERIAGVLARLKDRDAVKSLGLVGDKLLGAEDPAQVAYSVVLYERGADRNYVRIHADSLDQPFDINSGAKLILGSTAKLRTLATYLGVVAELHREMAGLPIARLHAAAATEDPLRRWSAEYLAGAGDRTLQPMLDAAMQRRYSGSPSETFFTGGGAHVFHNFERTEDYQNPTVEDAFAHSVNLAFVRLMRDLVRHYENEGGERDGLLGDLDNPARADYLRRFADKEGRAYLGRFYEEYRELTPDDAVAHLAARIRPIPRRLAVAFRSVRPEASEAEFGEFLAARLPGAALDEDDAAELHAKYAPKLFSLNDRGYLAGVNPLELWLVAYLQANPGASRSQVMNAGNQARQSAYSWLFKTRNAHKQDVRIRVLLEEDAFDRILQDWRQQGYPFERLVPSLATAIGSSGDRPEALAKLMGIIVNGGVKLPTTDLDRVHFAAGTPYETQMVYRPEAPERVMAPEVAATLRRALAGVVAGGTATRLRGAYAGDDDSAPLPVGGKTGTGDNRFDTFGPGHALIESRVVDRTATFVFFLGERFYGTVTAYVSGEEAKNYRFTSALAVSLLKALAPQLKPLIDAPAPDRYTRWPEESAAPRHAQNAVAIGAPPDAARDEPGSAAATN